MKMKIYTIQITTSYSCTFETSLVITIKQKLQQSVNKNVLKSKSCKKKNRLIDPDVI